MVTYEITAVVEPSLAADYERYMIDRHIPDRLATGHFVGATFSKSGDRYRILYEAHSRASLDEYLAHDAERLRADFHAHFPSGVSLTRETWEHLASFDAQGTGRQ